MQGTRNSVKIVPMLKPQTITFASGLQMSDLPPMPIAIGIRPNTVVMVVRRIGRRRNLPALRIERQRRIFCSRASLIKLMIYAHC